MSAPVWVFVGVIAGSLTTGLLQLAQTMLNNRVSKESSTAERLFQHKHEAHINFARVARAFETWHDGRSASGPVFRDFTPDDKMLPTPTGPEAAAAGRAILDEGQLAFQTISLYGADACREPAKDLLELWHETLLAVEVAGGYTSAYWVPNMSLWDYENLQLERSKAYRTYESAARRDLAVD
ncbi:hypothetical protein [Nocardioides sp. NPDC047086]|uniref:hypothetical protein n=1 Tax=Nocardioides sp. NPDC047086 TaxID=3154810 RepID=UPI0033C49295